MKQAQTISKTFLGVGYTRHRAGLPLEAVRVPVPQPAADEVLIRVAASSLNPLEYKLADLNFMGRTPPVVLGLDVSGIFIAAGHGVRGVDVGDAVAAMADLNGNGGWSATGESGGEGGDSLDQIISSTIIYGMKKDFAIATRRHRSDRREAFESVPCEESLGHRLRLAYHAWSRHFDAALRPLGLTPVQFIALSVIGLRRQRDEIPSQVQVAAATQLDPMMISKILRLLEERGYLKRSPHPDDPRANALHLTHAGDALLRAALPVFRDAHAAFFDGRFDADSQQALAELLDRMPAPAPAAN